jgi:hypothetical protein
MRAESVQGNRLHQHVDITVLRVKEVKDAAVTGKVPRESSEHDPYTGTSRAAGCLDIVRNRARHTQDEQDVQPFQVDTVADQAGPSDGGKPILRGVRGRLAIHAADHVADLRQWRLAIKARRLERRLAVTASPFRNR